MNTEEQIMHRIKEVLQKKKISQKELAIELEVAPNTLITHLNCKRRMSLETFIKISGCLGVSINYLAGMSKHEL